MNPQTYANLLALATMILWGISNGFMKVPSLRLGSAKAIRIRQFVMFGALVVYKIIFDSLAVENKGWALVAFLTGVFGYIPFYYFCEALRIGSIGTVNAIGNSFPAVTVVIVYFIFGTTISTNGIIGISITTLGIILLSISRNKHKVATNESKDKLKSTIYAIIACLSWGAFYSYVPIPNKHLDVLTLTLFLQLGSLFSSHIHSIAQRTRRNVPKKSLHFAFLAGITGLLGSLCFYSALHRGNSGIVTAIAGSSPFVGALFGHFIYQEKISKKEILGISVAVLGVAILSISK